MIERILRNADLTAREVKALRAVVVQATESTKWVDEGETRWDMAEALGFELVEDAPSWRDLRDAARLAATPPAPEGEAEDEAPAHLHLLRCVIGQCDAGCPRQGRPTRADGRCGCGRVPQVRAAGWGRDEERVEIGAYGLTACLVAACNEDTYSHPREVERSTPDDAPWSEVDALVATHDRLCDEALARELGIDVEQYAGDELPLGDRIAELLEVEAAHHLAELASSPPAPGEGQGATEADGWAAARRALVDARNRMVQPSPNANALNVAIEVLDRARPSAQAGPQAEGAGETAGGQP